MDAAKWFIISADDAQSAMQDMPAIGLRVFVVAQGALVQLVFWQRS